MNTLSSIKHAIRGAPRSRTDEESDGVEGEIHTLKEH